MTTGRFTCKRRKWTGAGAWNLYFLCALALHAFDCISINPWANLLLLIWVTLPVSNAVLNAFRQLIALAAGASLLWSESWLPSPGVLLENYGNLAHFTSAILAEPAAALANPVMVLAVLVIPGAWLALKDWIRFTTISVAGLLAAAFPGAVATLFAPQASHADAPQSVPASVQACPAPASAFAPYPLQTAPAGEEHLTAWLRSFYESEAGRRTFFPAAASESVRFDIAVLNISSLSNDDLEASGLNAHPVFSKFDVRFEAFNSAAAHAGPAALRLLTGACGQPSHAALYSGRRPACEWMTALEKAGWEGHLVMDHNGSSDRYLENLRLIGGVSAPLMEQKKLSTQYVSFDGTSVLRTADVFNAWMKMRDAASAPTVTLMNLIALNDGNRLPGTTSPAAFKPRAGNLLDDLEAFIDRLDAQGKPLMLIVVPDHGAAVRGDKVQVARLREIPSPSITQVPVLVKFIGLENKGGPRSIAGPTSYLALTELMARTIESGIYRSPAADHRSDLDRIVRNLPLTWPVSENSNAVVMPYAGETRLKLDNNRWLKYRK